MSLELLTKVSEGKLSGKKLYGRLLKEYISVCGDCGREIFENRVLAEAFSYFAHDQLRLTKEVLEVIERAGECKIPDINNYLSSVRFEDTQRQARIERLLRQLESLLIVYNDG